MYVNLFQLLLPLLFLVEFVYSVYRKAGTIFRKTSNDMLKGSGLLPATAHGYLWPA